jgi:hypothetical protein
MQPKCTYETNCNLVPSTSTQDIVNYVKIEISLWSCQLQGKVKLDYDMRYKTAFKAAPTNLGSKQRINKRTCAKNLRQNRLRHHA